LEQCSQRRAELTVVTEASFTEPVAGSRLAEHVVHVHRGVDRVERAWETQVVGIHRRSTRPVLGFRLHVLDTLVVAPERDVTAAFPPLRRAFDLLDADAEK
jgi:hypothetical protein